jgi:hypothetical protein
MTFEDTNRILVVLILLWAICALWPVKKRKEKKD